ncbi:MAG: LON peptidase substrate-binding domain-containing protein, partial [Gammaproteobacteria bacterium]|nr:LON peptidase substrate-binding domain-containing protein [Gammaproteobacteria bacterium]
MNQLPVLALRDVVVYPETVVPLFVGRQSSMAAVRYAQEMSGELLLVSQRQAATEAPERSDLYEVGTRANILQMLSLPDGTIKVLVEG